MKKILFPLSLFLERVEQTHIFLIKRELNFLRKVLSFFIPIKRKIVLNLNEVLLRGMIVISTKVSIRKRTLWIVLVAMTMSMVFNYLQYKENQSFKIRKGSDFQETVGLTLFRLEGESVDFFLNEENEDVLLERYLGQLNALSKEYRDMNINYLGYQIDYVKNQYRELAEDLEAGKEIKEHQENIEQVVNFITDILRDVQMSLGEDGNEILWYRELSKGNSETEKLVRERMDKFFNEQK